jgi:hypothetical protein
MTHDADEIRGFSLQRSRAVNERLHALSSERHRDADGAQSAGRLRGRGTGVQRIPAVRRPRDVAANRRSLRRRFLDVWDANFRIHTAQRSHDSLGRMGEHRLQLLDEVDRWLPLDFPTIDRRRARSGAYFRASYDAFARGERRRAAANLAVAFPTYPVRSLEPRRAVVCRSI